MALNTSHFSVPFRFDNITGHIAENEQDTIDDVADCIEMAFLVEPGYRVEVPTFGIPSQVFHLQPLNLTEMVNAAGLWEARADMIMNQITDVVDKTNLTDRVAAVVALREVIGG